MGRKAYDLLHVYCTTGVKPKLVQLAEANRRSLSAQIQYMIESMYKEQFSSTSETTTKE